MPWNCEVCSDGFGKVSGPMLGFWNSGFKQGYNGEWGCGNVLRLFLPVYFQSQKADANNTIHILQLKTK